MGDWTRYVILDQANGGLPVAAFDHPVGWRSDGRVLWNLQLAQMPVQVSAFVSSAERSLAVEFIPMQGFSWPPMPMTMPGQNAAGIIQLQPPPPDQAMTQLVLPNYRGRCENLRVLSFGAEPEPATPDPRMPGAQVQKHRITARVTYDYDGRGYEEEFRGRQVMMTPGGWGAPVFWQLTDMCCFRSDPGKLDSALGEFERIEKSYEFNPQWQQFLQQTIQRLLGQSAQATDALLESGRRQIEINGEASRAFMARNAAYVQQQQDRINAMPNPVYTGTSSTFSAAKMMDEGSSDYSSHDRFVDTINEVQSVHNPENTANEKISSHVQHVWKDHNGNLVGSDDPNFDPNTGTEFGNWTRAQVKRPRS